MVSSEKRQRNSPTAGKVTPVISCPLPLFKLEILAFSEFMFLDDPSVIFIPPFPLLVPIMVSEKDEIGAIMHEAARTSSSEI
jgi:hypothetical protein